MIDGYSAYKQTDINTARPRKIVLMLYDGAIGFLNRSVEYAVKKDIKNKNIFLNKARDIIQELNNSLNTEIGGEFAFHLRRLYFFMNRHLLRANLENDSKAIREVIQLLSSLREAWEDAYRQQTGPGAPPHGQIEIRSYRQPGIRI